MEKEASSVVSYRSQREMVGIPTMTFGREQIELVKRTVAKGATDDELALFLYTCKRTGLDPLAKQIHCVKRNGKNGPQVTFQTAIDGYRLVADRTGKYAGNDDPIFKGGPDHPDEATVSVFKIVNGERCHFAATARWSEYFPGESQGFMWKKMPYLMLGKCAEALALRKAFPAELSGVYTDEEMHQADNLTIDTKAEPPEGPKVKEPAKENQSGDVISEPQAKRLYAIAKGAGKTDEEIKDYLKTMLGIDSSKKILKSDYDAVCEWAAEKSL
jgi:phage recombination protein Bet